MAEYYFQYGPDLELGDETAHQRTGPEITPRSVVATLGGLTPGAAVYFRLVATSVHGTSYGRTETFVAR